MRNRIIKRAASKRAAKRFAKLLRVWRKKNGLTLQALGKETGMHFATIGKLEQCTEGCGPDRAKRLARALKLTGWERELFLSAAAQTCRQNLDYGHLPPQVLRWLAYTLIHSDVPLEHIKEAVIEPGPNIGERNCDLVICLPGNRSFAVEFKEIQTARDEVR